MKRTFYVKALWDDEAKVWCSQTDIEGLFIETRTLEEFAEIMPELARNMIIANHSPKSGADALSPEDMFATVTWMPPTQLPTAA